MNGRLPDGYVIGYGHEWVERLPVGYGLMRCIRCGHKTHTSEFRMSPRCHAQVIPEDWLPRLGT